VALMVVEFSPADKAMSDDVGVTRIALLLVGVAAADTAKGKQITSPTQIREVTAPIPERHRRFTAGVPWLV
jgi:hypothetical protein